MQALVLPVAVGGLHAGAGGGGELGVDVAGEDDFEKRAQVLEGVFHRCAGEEEAALRVERAEAAGVERAAVFRVLRLVGDDGGEIDLGEEFGVAGEGAVGGDEQIVRGGGLDGGDALRAVVNKYAKRGSETRGLAAPVFDERGGADDQAGAAFFFRDGG